jgi:hypothetical protein
VSGRVLLAAPGAAMQHCREGVEDLAICGGLYGNTSGESMLWTTAVLSASNISNSPFLFSAQSIVK